MAKMLILKVLHLAAIIEVIQIILKQFKHIEILIKLINKNLMKIN